MSYISEKLRELRAKKGVSQADVAKRLGVSRATYVQYETGVNTPMKKLSELASFYGVTTDYLLGRQEIKKGLSGDKDFSKTQEEINNEAARTFLKLICKDSPQALEIINRITITAAGEVSIPTADKLTQAIINVQLKNFVEALKNAKPNNHGTFDVTFDVK